MVGRWSELLGDFFHRVTLDVVADLKLGKAVDANAALHAGAHFIDFVLKTAQRLGNAFINDFLATTDAHLAFDNASIGNHATGHGRALGQFENLADLSHSESNVFKQRLEHAGHAFFNLVNQLVN